MINTHQGLCPLYYLVGKKVCGQDQNWVLRQELHWTLQGKPKDFNQAIDYNSGHFPLSAMRYCIQSATYSVCLNKREIIYV